MGRLGGTEEGGSAAHLGAQVDAVTIVAAAAAVASTMTPPCRRHASRGGAKTILVAPMAAEEVAEAAVM